MPAITPSFVRAYLNEHQQNWKSPLARPFSFEWPREPATLRQTPGLADELRRVADEIADEHWLRVYAHKPHVTEAARAMLDARVPTYRPWRDFLIAGQIELDARQELWQRDVGDNMPALALAALIWGDEKYLRSLRSHVGAACAYPTWGADGAITNRDLACAHLARGIAIARDWLPDFWSPGELDLMRQTIENRAGELLKGAYGGAYWHRNWRDNHCHNAVAALGICGVVFRDELPAASAWLAAAELGLERVAHSSHADGSSAEGVPYWSYGTSFLLQYIEAARGVTGAHRFYETPYFKNAFRYRLQCSTPALGATLPFGDAIKHDYYGPSHLLRAWARQFQDAGAQWLAENIPFRQSGGADCEAWNLLWNDPSLQAAPPALDLDAHFPDWDVAVSRSGWAREDYVLAVKSGFCNRNHSHLDSGALVLAWGDEWLLTAPGYGIVGPGFWDFNGGKRWDFYSNSTESHTTLLINGENQRFDRDARGTIVEFQSEPQFTRIIVDLTGVYRGAKSVRREITHHRQREITICDTIELEEIGTVEWLLQPGGEVELRGGTLVATGCNGRLKIEMLAPALPFAPRAPTRPHLDVAPQSVKTHAVSQRGQQLSFVCRI